MRLACVAVLLVLTAISTANAFPIPDPLPTTLPRYKGAPATSRPLRATVAPRNPYLARDPRSTIQPYFWTAIDARTGTTAWKAYAGSGLGFNNNYAGLALGPDGTAYLGVTGGIVALRDSGR